jgi:putative transposase
LPDVLRVDNGPEFLGGEFVSWAESAGIFIQYIQPGEPNQNAYIERSNRTYRKEVLNLYLFRNLAEVRETTYWWMINYNENRPHDSLENMTPLEVMEQYAGKTLLSNCLLDRKAYGSTDQSIQADPGCSGRFRDMGQVGIRSLR